MTARDGSTFGDLPQTELLRINRLCNQFEAAWKAGEQPTVESLLPDLAADARRALLRELVPLEIEYRRRAVLPISLDDYVARFPELDRPWLAKLLDAASVLPEKLGDYRIVGRIGGGGMGTVYKAVHERMGRTVALKVLRAEKQSDPAWLQRFDREARAAARLTHVNIVAALDAREHAGIHFLVTELVEGTDLEAAVRRGGPLPVGEAVDCIVQAARGLDYAHRQGVVHRDIKPANLLRDDRGVVKVLDMGLARLDAAEDPSATALTKSGMVMGTAAYMAPEQARDTRRADARSDIYSLGCTLYFLISGRPMFEAATVVDAILSHVSQPSPPLSTADSQVSPALDAVFRRMVAKDPQERFQSAAELIAALEPHLSKASTSSAAQDPLSPMASRTASRHWLFVGGALAAAAIVAAGLFAWLADGRDSPPSGSRHVLMFNGYSSYVAAPDFEPVAGADYTLEAICQPRSFRTSNVISWLGPDWMAVFLSADGQWGLARRFSGEDYLRIAAEPAQLDTMVHLAAVYRHAELRLFVDGRQVKTIVTTFPLGETRGGLFVGGVAPGQLPQDQDDRFFAGTIDAVRISRGVRYHRDFTAPRSLARDEATIAVFRFDEGRGSETHSLDDPAWTGQIVDAVWQSQ